MTSKKAPEMPFKLKRRRVRKVRKPKNLWPNAWSKKEIEPDCLSFGKHPNEGFRIATDGNSIEWAEEVHAWLGQWIAWARQQREGK